MSEKRSRYLSTRGTRCSGGEGCRPAKSVSKSTPWARKSSRTEKKVGYDSRFQFSTLRISLSHLVIRSHDPYDTYCCSVLTLGKRKFCS